jgi:hypothetical protein
VSRPPFWAKQDLIVLHKLLFDQLLAARREAIDDEDGHSDRGKSLGSSEVSVPGNTAGAVARDDRRDPLATGRKA